MVVHRSKNMTTAKKLAMRFRRKGFNATVFDPKGKGVSVSVTRRK